jgi:hypothetical protein
MMSQSLGLLSAIVMAVSPVLNPPQPNTMNRCTPSVEPAITMTVLDAQTGTPLEATILVEDGEFQEQLNWWGVTAAGQIIYAGVFERPGIYTVKVSKPGYKTVVLKDIEVKQDSCHVSTHRLTVKLEH